MHIVCIELCSLVVYIKAEFLILICLIIVIEALNRFNIGNMEGRGIKSRMGPLVSGQHSVGFSPTSDR